MVQVFSHSLLADRLLDAALSFYVVWIRFELGKLAFCLKLACMRLS